MTESQTSQVIDRQVLTNLVESTGGDDKFLAGLIDVYIENSAKLLDMMRTAIERNNADEMRLAAHSCKSDSLSFGAYELAKLCRELEDTSRTGNLSEAAGLVTLIRSEYERVNQVLQTLRPSP